MSIQWIKWIKTADQPPPLGKIVLGYDRTVVMESVVFRDDGWRGAPGYPNHPRRMPEYWAELPNLPDGIERGE